MTYQWTEGQTKFAAGAAAFLSLFHLLCNLQAILTCSLPLASISLQPPPFGLILAFQTPLFCQFPQTKTLIGVSLSRFSSKNTSLSCYSANHVVFKCSLEAICATNHAWQIDRQTVEQTEAKQLRRCQGILEDSR